MWSAGLDMSLKSVKKHWYEDRGMKRFTRWPIVARLMTLYTLSALIILSVTNFILYRDMVRNLELKNDLYIRDEINVLKAMLRGPNSEKEFAREIELEHAERKNVKHYARVLDEKGTTLMENPEMEAVISPEVFPSPQAGYVTHGDRIKFRAQNGSLYILKTLRTEISGFAGKAKFLQIAMDVSDLYVFEEEYRKKLFEMLILGVLASALAGSILSRRGLRPLLLITQTAHQITASHLNERLDPNLWPKELHSLSIAFNSMLCRLESSFEDLSNYSANLAHELRTPINNLMVEADVALSRSRTPEEYQKVIGSSMEEYSRLSRVIDGLLFLARTEKAQTSPNLAPLEVHEEINEVAEFYSAVANDKEIKITCNGEALLFADPLLLRRALSNILSNALNHTPPNGEVIISAHQNDDLSVEIAVSDNGCGIAQEHLSRIFDRFYRVTSKQQQGSEGSGLGLAIVKAIVNLHGGVIDVRSEQSVGTTVTMKFLPQTN